MFAFFFALCYNRVELCLADYRKRGTMFGYVRTDTPYLFIKDDTLYKAMYCGVCKGIGETCSQSARMGLSYDVTFLSVILHNIMGLDVKIEKQHCLTHCIRSKQMAEVDELTKKLGALNTILVYYKYTDDIADGDKGKGKRLWFQEGFKKAKKYAPELESIVKAQLALQEKAEKAKTDSLDRSADATAVMLAKLTDCLLGEKGTENTHNLFYAVGKWIYLIDALDDYDKDIKKGAYNPFVLRYKKESLSSLMQSEERKEVEYAFHSLFFDIRENLSKIKFHFNRDLSDNILLRGLPMMTKKVMEGKTCEKHKREKKENTK